MGVIYKITSPNNRVYVGKTYNLRKRINSHRIAHKNGSTVILHNSIAKYGWDAHKLEVIEEIEDDKLNEREIYWIAELKTYCHENPDGMNMTRGGDGQRSTWMHKTELRKWFSEKFSGEKNPFYGKTHSKEVRANLSQIAKNRSILSGKRVPAWGAEKGRQKVIKAAILYNKAGDFVGEYPSLIDCARCNGLKSSSVRDSVLHGSWINGEYLVKYKTENYPIKIIPGEIKTKTEKRAVVLMTQDYDEIAEFPSALEASEFTGVPKGTINRAALNNWLVPIRTGHVFIYRDLYDQIFEEAI